jgi:osmotically-inducible protein OsmY
LSAASLQGCAAVIVAGAAGAGVGGGYVLSQERSLGDTARDTGIRAVITKSWRDANVKLADDLDCTVYEGRVLLTGEVTSEDLRQEAVKRAWQVDGVKEVYDEIQVGPEEGFTQDVSDGVISNKMRAAMIGDGDVKSVNYTVTTVNGVVYLIGSARSQDELNRVLDHARNTGNVRRVVSYVRIRVGEPPHPEATAAAPTNVDAAPINTSASPGPGYPPAPPDAPAPPANAAPPAASSPTAAAPIQRQSIEVTPLK